MALRGAECREKKARLECQYTHLWGRRKENTRLTTRQFSICHYGWVLEISLPRTDRTAILHTPAKPSIAQVKSTCQNYMWSRSAPATPASPDLPDPQLHWLSGTCMADGAGIVAPIHQPNVNSRLPATFYIALDYASVIHSRSTNAISRRPSYCFPAYSVLSHFFYANTPSIATRSYSSPRWLILPLTMATAWER